MGAVMYRESTSSPWQELPLIGSINIGGTGGTGGQFAQATITKTDNLTFDVSNYVKGHNQFILFYTYGTQDRGAFAPFLADKPLTINRKVLNTDKGIESLYIDDDNTDVRNTVFIDTSTSYCAGIEYNPTTGIIKFSGITQGGYYPGVSATLLYID